MARVNKTSLQYRCFTAGLSTEGTKKDVLARLRIYNATDVVEAMIHKEAVQVPENGESSKGQYCGQEIARELQSAIPGQSATASARWGNAAGLLKLEMTDGHKELKDRLAAAEAEMAANKAEMSAVKAEMAAVHAEMPKLKADYANSLAIRNRFFSSFLRDHHPAQYMPGEHKKNVAGDDSAHHWAPLLDSYLYTDGVRSDVSTFVMLYGLRPDQILLLRDKEALKVLEYHATVVANSDEVPGDFEEAFLKFIRAIEAGGFYDGFLEENKQPETRHYWECMQKYSSLLLE